SDVLETRLAALHALEKLSRSSPGDQWDILGIMTAFVRRRAPSPGRLADDDLSAAAAAAPVSPSSADVQRALSIVTLNAWVPPTPRPERTPDESEWEFRRRLETYTRTYRVNLSQADLRGAVKIGRASCRERG